MIWSLIKPWAFMVVSAVYLPITVVKLLLAGDLNSLLSWPAFKEAWFGYFWTWIGPVVKGEAEEWVVPLIDGRVSKGRVTEKTNNAPINGTVLEIGAGSGMWAHVLANAVRKQDNSTNNGDENTPRTKIYGVEPNPISAAALNRRVEEVGLKGTYEVLPYGIEDLKKETKIGPGSVDCIITVHCLCSIPEPEKNIRLLYEYLKPGGRWYVFEHVKAEQGVLVPYFQRFTNNFWEFFVGSCHLCRPTLDTIIASGEWDDYDLASPSGESSWEIIPHLIGALTKASRKESS
jgi:SAM-dependent methyltransferase